MKKRYLECGIIVSTHGLRGEVKVKPWSDTPDFLCGFATLYLERGERAVKVESARANRNLVLVKLRGIDGLDEAAALRGRVVYIDREDMPPDEDGVFFVQDLIGLRVLDVDTGREWGNLSDVFVTGANDVYEITGDDGKKRLVPAIRDVVLETDVENGVMRIRPLEGLFDED